MHRLMAYLVFAWPWACWPGACGRVPAFARTRAGWPASSLLQAVTGISNAVLGWPLLAAVSHTGGAAALGAWCSSGVVFASRSTSHRRPHASKSDA